MPKNSQIESFFNALDFSWQDLIEFLPVGVIIFDENWQIKSVNKKFTQFFAVKWIDIKLEGLNLFSRNILSDKLPLSEILELKEGRNFEKIVSVKGEDKDLILVFRGSPIFKEGVFKGGNLIIEDSSVDSIISNKFNPSSITFTNFLKKICNCYLIINQKGNIQYVSNDIKSKCTLFESSLGENIIDLFISDGDLKINEVLQHAVSDRKSKSIELSYFSEEKKINFKSVFVPVVDQNNVTSVIILLKEKNRFHDDNISYLSDLVEMREYESFATAEADGLFKINLHGNITFWAENASNLFNISKSMILSDFIGKIFPEVTHKSFEEIRKIILADGVWEGYLRISEGSKLSKLKVRILSEIYENETELYVYCYRINSRRQKLQEANEEENLFFKDTVFKSNQMILQANPNGTILYTNEQFGNKFEYGLDEIRGVLFTDLIEEKFKIRYGLTAFESLLNRKEFEVLPLVSKSGKVFEVCYSINLSTSNSELKYFTIYFTECSLRDKLFLETAHALLYQFSEPIVIIHDKRIIKVNPKFCELFGNKLEADFFDLPINKIIDSKSQSVFNNLIESNLASDDIIEISLVKNDNEILNVDAKKICCSKDSSFSVLVFQTEKSETTSINKSQKIRDQFGEPDSFTWSGSFVKNELVVDYIENGLLRILGYSELENNFRQNIFNNITHPNDIDKINGELLQLAKNSEEKNKEVVYRFINKDGDVVWIKNKIKISNQNIDEKVNFYGIISDITDWTLERNELKSIINELDRLNSAKEKFISIISHDLKSPFTSIVGFSELILTDPSIGKEDIIQYVGHIKDASMHTVDLLNSLLDLTKLQTGRVDVEPKIINANYIAQKSLEILLGTAIQKGITLSTNIDKSFFITADDNLILQVFNNLVANSIKFTPKGGTIEILARELPDQQKIEFTVKDSGVGMAQEDMDKLFVLEKKFTTLGTDGERGTGLGLNLVKEIIDKHKGNIHVNSKLNIGSEFIFTLPISSPSILVVDGIKAERVLYAKLLESITESIEIIQTSNEQEALKIIQQKMPLLVVFEHQLPHMKGDEFIGEVLKSELIYQPSLIVLTKEYSKELSEFYKDIGVYDVFGKPFDLKEFKTKLDKLTGKIETN